MLRLVVHSSMQVANARVGICVQPLAAGPSILCANCSISHNVLSHAAIATAVPLVRAWDVHNNWCALGVSARLQSKVLL